MKNRSKRFATAIPKLIGAWNGVSRSNGDLAGYSAEGGELTTYLLNTAVRKMVAQLYGERSRSTEEYYFWDGRLFFVFRTESHYDKPLSSRVVERAEERFYFSDGALIRWLVGTKEIPAASSEAKQRGRELLDRATELSNLAKGAQAD